MMLSLEVRVLTQTLNSRANSEALYQKAKVLLRLMLYDHINRQSKSP